MPRAAPAAPRPRRRILPAAARAAGAGCRCESANRAGGRLPEETCTTRSSGPLGKPREERAGRLLIPLVVLAARAQRLCFGSGNASDAEQEIEDQCRREQSD